MTEEMNESKTKDETLGEMLPAAVNCTDCESQTEPDGRNVPIDLRFQEPYAAVGGFLGMIHTGRDGEIFTPLCTFVPYIQAELTYDDGKILWLRQQKSKRH